MTFIPLLIADDDDEPWMHIPAPTLIRIYIMIALFLVSLFAVFFPGVARTRRSLRVPSILFFVGKHFGTGVILATAFAHLLQDAFASLMSEKVKERWAIGKWVGLIVLGSLLSIFFVEYISTSFVDRLHSYSSVPSSPASSSPSHSPKPSSPPLSTRAHLPSPPPDSDRTVDLPQPAITVQNPCGPSSSMHTLAETEEQQEHLLVHRAGSERTPISASSAQPRYATFSSHGLAHSHPHEYEHASEDEIFAGGHHRHEERGAHAAHHSHQYWEGWRTWLGLRFGSEDSTDDEEAAEAALAEAAERLPEHRNPHAHWHAHAHLNLEDGYFGTDAEGNGVSVGREMSIEDGEEAETVKVGRRRQVVGILMLQLGIMTHSLVIGLTLAITSGPEFTSLVVAIAFHQLFEGLSLGIRIAGLPESGIGASLFSRALKPTLSLAFALTTPIGIALGLGVFAPSSAGGDDAQLLLIQGLMSALSAGMLIYAACVEMLAGDFVMDPRLWRASILRQALALCSLFSGVGAMAVVGLFD